MGAVSETAVGVRVKVRLTPRASRDEIAGLRDGGEGALAVRVTAPPAENRANRALCKLIARELGIAKGRVVVVAGGKSRDKVVEIEGFDASAVREWLARR